MRTELGGERRQMSARRDWGQALGPGTERHAARRRRPSVCCRPHQGRAPRAAQTHSPQSSSFISESQLSREYLKVCAQRFRSNETVGIIQTRGIRRHSLRRRLAILEEGGQDHILQPLSLSLSLSLSLNDPRSAARARRRRRAGRPAAATRALW